MDKDEGVVIFNTEIKSRNTTQFAESTKEDWSKYDKWNSRD